MNADFTVAILGASHWHLPCYLQPAVADGHRVILHDADPARAEAAAAKYRASQGTERITVGGEAQAVLAARPDFAVLLGQPAETAEFIGLCLDYGVPFLAEKPGALRADTLWEYARRCQAQGLFNAGPFSLRWDEVGLRVKALLDEGRLGRIGSVSISYFSGAASRYVKWGCPWVLELARNGGGGLYNCGLHLLDLLRFWGLNPRYRHGRATYNLNRGEVDDLATLLLDLDDGAYAVLESGYTVQNPFGGLCFSIYAEKANVDYRQRTLKISWADGTVETFENPAPEPRERMQAELIACARAGRPAPVTLADMAAALEICNQFTADPAAVSPANTEQ